MRTRTDDTMVVSGVRGLEWVVCVRKIQAVRRCRFRPGHCGRRTRTGRRPQRAPGPRPGPRRRPYGWVCPQRSLSPWSLTDSNVVRKKQDAACVCPNERIHEKERLLMREPIEGRLAKQATMTTRVTGQDFECGSALLGADHDSASMEVLLRGHSRVRIFRFGGNGLHPSSGRRQVQKALRGFRRSIPDC